MDEGYVKYTCHHRSGPTPEHPALAELDEFRTQLFDGGLVGQLENGVGFGNLSLRDGDGFIITSTGTGGARTLGQDGYCRVEVCDINNNSVTSCGPLQASSEALSHAAIYAASSTAHYVAHIHSEMFFQQLQDAGVLATPVDAAYGTPDMARAVFELVRQRPLEGVIVMGGHHGGILIYGPSLVSLSSQVFFLQSNYAACPCKGLRNGLHHDSAQGACYGACKEK